MSKLIMFLVDADSLIHKTYHANKEEELELMYLSFCNRLSQVLWQGEKFAKDKLLGKKTMPVVLLSPKHSFRNRLTPSYKSNRPEQPQKITDLKYLAYERLSTIVEVNPEVEADDLFIYYMNQTTAIGAAIDKDILNVANNSVYDYNKRRWADPQWGLSTEEWYIMQSLMGDDSDGIVGVPGMGAVKAKEFAKQDPSYYDWANLFSTEEEAILTMRLVRMDQWNGSEVELWTPDKWGPHGMTRDRLPF